MPDELRARLLSSDATYRVMGFCLVTVSPLLSTGLSPVRPNDHGGAGWARPVGGKPQTFHALRCNNCLTNGFGVLGVGVDDLVALRRKVAVLDLKRASDRAIVGAVATELDDVVVGIVDEILQQRRIR